MNITVTDTALLTPTGGIASNTPIRIVCLEGYDQVLTGAISEFTTDDAGAYSFPLYYGVHAIYVRFDTKFKLLGKVTITSELADTATISDLLLYTEPMLPDEIALVSGLVEEARGYAEDAEEARDESVAIKDSLAPLSSVADIPSLAGYSVGDKITWLGYYSPSDGGSNWGIVKEGQHTQDGYSAFTISGDFYVEANLSGKTFRKNIKKSGAKVDGVTDDFNSISAMINYHEDRFNLFFPEGETLIGSKIETEKAPNFIGVGSGISYMVFPASDGVKVDRSTLGSSDDTIIFKDISVVAKSQGLYTGIEVTGARVLTPVTEKARLNGVNLHGYDITTASDLFEWKTAVYFNECDKATMTNVFIYGKERSAIKDYDTETVGVKIFNSTGITCNNVAIYRVKSGVEVTGQGEGLGFFGGRIVAVYRGVHMYDLEAPSNNHCISDTHIAAEMECINIGGYLDGGQSSFHNISSSFLLQRKVESGTADNSTGDARKNWRGIVMNANDSTVDRITVFSALNGNLLPLTDENAGVEISGGSFNNISNIIGRRVGTTVKSNLTGSSYNTFDNITTDINDVESGEYQQYDINTTDMIVCTEGSGVKTNRAARHEMLTQSGIALKIINGSTSPVNALEIYSSNSENKRVTLRAADTTDGENPDVDIAISPAGSGLVRFGAHTSDTGSEITGYIEIKDSSGNIRRLLTGD